MEDRFPKDLEGRFEALGLLGRGGMSSVWEVRRRSDGRCCALKVMSDELASDPVFRRRFRLEAKLAGARLHAGLVEILEAGEDPPWFWIAMEKIRGRNLSAELEEARPFSVQRTLRLSGELADCLGALHHARYVHRDLKAENVMLEADGRPRLLDLGLVRQLAEPGPTRTGILLGTPWYMSPEVCRGEKAGATADVYALGLIAWECLSPRDPFEAHRPKPGRLLALRAGGKAELPVPEGLPPSVLALLRCLVADAPSDRPANGMAAAHAIRLVLESQERERVDGDATRVTGEGPWLGEGRSTRGGAKGAKGRRGGPEEQGAGGQGRTALEGDGLGAPARGTLALLPRGGDGDAVATVELVGGPVPSPRPPRSSAKTRRVKLVEGPTRRGRHRRPLFVLLAVLLAFLLALTLSRRPGEGPRPASGDGRPDGGSLPSPLPVPAPRSSSPEERRKEFEKAYAAFLAEGKRQASSPILRRSRQLPPGVGASVALDALRLDWRRFREHSVEGPREEGEIVAAMARTAANHDFLRRVDGVDGLDLAGDEGLAIVSQELSFAMRDAEDKWARSLRQSSVARIGVIRTSLLPYFKRQGRGMTRPHFDDLGKDLVESRVRAVKRAESGEGPPLSPLLDLATAMAIRHHPQFAPRAMRWARAVRSPLMRKTSPDRRELDLIAFSFHVSAQAAATLNDGSSLESILREAEHVLAPRVRPLVDAEAFPFFARQLVETEWTYLNHGLDGDGEIEEKNRAVLRGAELVRPGMGMGFRKKIFETLVASPRLRGEDRKRIIEAAGDFASSYSPEFLGEREE